MVEKRDKKLDKLIQNDLQEPEYTGKEDIDYLIIGWGSTYGPILEAQNQLQNEGVKIGFLSFCDLWPLPQSELKKRCQENVELIIVENNSTAQLARLIASETGIEINNKILKYDGRPFTGKEIYKRITNEVIK